jgi:hypothetical protein
MTTFEVTLPDDLAGEAHEAGLLARENVESLLRAQLRQRRVGELFEAMDRMNALDDTPAMSPEDIAVELAAMRAEKRSSTSK